MINNSEAKYLDLRETQIAIKSLKDYFQRDLASTLNLARVSAPLFVRPETGLNDNLSGEKAVNFNIRKYDINVEIVQSLAKWKRNALKKYNFGMYEGIYADMNAIRAEESLDNIHSSYVDQWDWEKIIGVSDRNDDYLHLVVKEIFSVFKRSEEYINQTYPYILSKKLPEKIFFVSSQELEDAYPDLSPKEREHEITKDKKAVFIQGIGKKLKSGKPHDLRSPDYDDWDLNGDIIFWDSVLNDSIELSSMGIRVDEDSIVSQCKICGNEDRLALPYHRDIIEKNLPYTIGGGIGQSRICMYFLEKKHIGEVQVGVWDELTRQQAKKDGIILL
ncbi:asparagine synthase [Peptoniphilus lacrimalis DNF00528]|uniref:Aspartate--ammonia ligase n=1 Tax=Peptoniphilus lacrimalis 315-B TaxID=596330 RepID=D1VUW5_9FIRM|nr:aspartate--ammonia ligase [Peptoniphilus lacrimalis]EFA89658.1 aspartate--ammonia ligase [Peptoniphilus lacrimalis 315-B]KGF29634.1 asparagine synthase [Peptoniphilus lacrimalis DNF00528]